MANIKLQSDYWETSGVYDIGQSKTQRVINNDLVTGKANKSETVSTITYDSTNHKLTKTINGTTTDVMTVDTTPTENSMNPISSDAAYDLNGAITQTNADVAYIVSGKKSTTAIAKGKYVLVRNSTISGITDGLYTASQAIPANTNLTSAYFSSTTGGGLNSAEEINEISTGITGLFAYKRGNIVELYTKNTAMVLPTITSNGWISMGTLPDDLVPKTSANADSYIKSFALTNTTNTVVAIRISNSNNVISVYGRPAYSEEALNIFFTYFV